MAVIAGPTPPSLVSAAAGNGSATVSWSGANLDGETLLSDGPGIETEEFIAGIDVVSCADRQQAIELAAAHPIARYYAIEVRPFWSE